MTLPNTLTLLRLLAAPGVIVSLLVFPRPWSDWIAVSLFVGAAVTDWIDGYLARRWGQVSRFGAMLDPIADKAMVILALVALAIGPAGQGAGAVWFVIPTILIIFREVFVSGLREFLGSDAARLKVTRLAKWKTTVQMVAIAVLLAAGLFEHYAALHAPGTERVMVEDMRPGRGTDHPDLVWSHYWMIASWYGGLALLWISACLTIVTGADYLLKAMPYLREA